MNKNPADQLDDLLRQAACAWVKQAPLARVIDLLKSEIGRPRGSDSASIPESRAAQDQVLRKELPKTRAIPLQKAREVAVEDAVLVRERLANITVGSKTYARVRDALCRERGLTRRQVTRTLQEQLRKAAGKKVKK